MDRLKLRSNVQVAEGYSTHAYKDTRGFWTAGYGHLLDQSKDWTGVSFSIEQIEAWLDADLAAAEAQAVKLDEWTALDTDARQNALVELVFNMGIGKWHEFVRTRMWLSLKHWAQAAAELLNSAWAVQVGHTRSARIARYIASGVFD